MTNFRQRADKLGIGMDALKNGREVSQTLTVRSIGELRKIMGDGLNAERRRARASRLQAARPDLWTATNTSPEAIVYRAQANVFADVSLSDSDSEWIAARGPLEVRTMAVEDKTLSEGEVWDLGTSLSPLTVEVGTLTMQPGSSIVIRNTVLNLNIDTLIVNSGSTAGPGYHVGIFGVTGLAGENNTAVPPTPDKAGTGDKGECDGGGGVAVKSGGKGRDGEKGGEGYLGGDGADGLPSQSAYITIGEISIKSTSQSFVVKTQSGEGGVGGKGGTGGTGGAGGTGGKGPTCGCECKGGGDGGKGGTGGKGGRGGQGGRGTDGYLIEVSVPDTQTDYIVPVRADAVSGYGGTGGDGGQGGAGGAGGAGGGASGCPKCSKGSTGSNGDTGDRGDPGAGGLGQGLPGEIRVIGVRKD